jgi:hypothetical protein
LYKYDAGLDCADALCGRVMAGDVQLQEDVVVEICKYSILDRGILGKFDPANKTVCS